MYTSNNHIQSQQSQHEFTRDSEGFPIGHVVKKAMTKVRDNLSGPGQNRGILILHRQTNQERWVSVDANSPVARCKNGTMLYFHGKGQRPSLSMGNVNASVQPPLSNYNDQYNSLGESIEDSYNPSNGYQEEINYNYNNQQTSSQDSQPRSSDNTVDDALIEKLSLLMSNCVNMAQQLNPQLSEESVVKLAISVSIAYQKIKSDLPY